MQRQLTYDGTYYLDLSRLYCCAIVAAVDRLFIRQVDYDVVEKALFRSFVPLGLCKLLRAFPFLEIASEYKFEIPHCHNITIVSCKTPPHMINTSVYNTGYELN